MSRGKLVYAAIVVFVTVIAMGLLNVAYTNHVNAQRERSDEANVAARREQAVQARAVVCALVNANVRAYEESPPTSPAGRNLAEAWRRLRVQFGC